MDIGPAPTWRNLRLPLEELPGLDDADAIAQRAVELGGRVLVPPFDAPWVRMTVISDPQGATFTATKFVPENRELPAGAGAAAGG